jgi:hypothetical protein
MMEVRGGSGDLVWLVPIPGDPALEVTFQLDWLEMPNTPPIFYLPPFYCSGLYPSQVDHEGYYDDSATYPYNILNMETLSAGEVREWLINTDYEFTAPVRQSIQHYARQGMSFAVVNLEPMYKGDGRWERHRVMISYKYRSDSIILPVQLLTADQEGFGLDVNILADHRYIVTNYPHAELELDEARIRPAISNYLSADAGALYYADRGNLEVLISDAQRTRSRAPFYTRIAAPTLLLMEEMFDDDRDKGFSFRTDLYPGAQLEILRSHRYLTQMEVNVSSRAITMGFPDPVFVAAPNAPIVSNVLEPRNVDPLTFWGCTSRFKSSSYDEFSAHIPPGRTPNSAVRPTQLIYAHPEGWQRYDVDFQGHSIALIAPEPVDASTLGNYLNGEPTPPMLLSRYYPPELDRNPCAPYYGMTLDEDAVRAPYSRCIHRGAPDAYREVRWVIAILTSPEDFAAHEAMYRAMVDFPSTFQYMLHPELRYALLLNPAWEWTGTTQSIVPVIPSIGVAYPEGWVEEVVGTSRILIMPDTATRRQAAPYVSIYPASDVGTPTFWDSGEDFREGRTLVADWLVTHFGIERDPLLEEYLANCSTLSPIAPFSHHGRTGFVQYITHPYLDQQAFVVEISAPDAVYDDYAQELQYIRESLINFYGCG